jgi:hypothetical protein
MSLLRGRIDPATGMFTSYDQPAESTRELDPAIATHEARHTAAALLLGLKVTEARADNPNPEMGGYVRLGDYSCLRPRDSGIMTLAGRWGDPAGRRRTRLSRGAPSTSAT